MFTGIIEEMVVLTKLRPEQSNLHLSFRGSLSHALKIDQSVSHNGVCLTVIDIADNEYSVTAVAETLQRSNLGQLKVGDLVNFERCMPMNGRLDGHLVQGHVDTMGRCLKKEEKDGSWLFHFEHPRGQQYLTVPKGSITINGVSLTVVDSAPDQFSVAIIPYTYEHTNFRALKPGHPVNLEFDIVGKYVARLMEHHFNSAK